MIAGKKGQGHWWEIVWGIVAIIALVAIAFFIITNWGILTKTYGNMVSTYANQGKTFAKLSQEELDKAWSNDENVKQLQKQTQEQIDFALSQDCNIAKNEFLVNIKKILDLNRKDSTNTALVLMDLKQNYQRIIACYLDKSPFQKIYCDDAYGLYQEVAIKKQGPKDKEYTILDKTKDKEVLGNSLFDIAVCYKNNGENDKAKNLFDEFLREYGQTNEYNKANVDFQLASIKEPVKEGDKKLLEEFSKTETEKGKILDRYLVAADYYKRKDYDRSKIEFQNIISDYGKYSDIAKVKQLLANSYYNMSTSELERNRIPNVQLNVDNCYSFEVRYKEFVNRAYIRETFIRSNKLIDEQFMYGVGKCFEDTNVEVKYSETYTNLFNKYPEFFRILFPEINCEKFLQENECNSQYSWLDLNKISSDKRGLYKCYWTDVLVIGKNQCKACFNGMKCSDYASTNPFKDDSQTCNSDPCNIGCVDGGILDSYLGRPCLPK